MVYYGKTFEFFGRIWRMIYLFCGLDTLSEEWLQRGLLLLPPRRRDYVLRFGLAEARKQSMVGWLLLAYGMRKEYGMKKIPDFHRAASGKPFFPGENMPFFNLSHSGSFVCCGLDAEEIGLDIQKLTPARSSLVRRVCTKEELAAVKSDLDFVRIWAMKESAGKLTGEGITGSFRDILVLHPGIHTHAVPLENGAGFLAYSTYRKRNLPVLKVSARQLLACV